jgi:7-carboxy-7-deazaguanine synthase
MFGKNKILKPENHEGLYLDVVEIFPTLQGEGPYAGHPSVFIRLGGCNLSCNFCDTEFEKYQNLSLQKILEEVQELSKNSAGKIIRNLIVITGGEPLRQPITRLCEELLKLNFLVQIETNGTIFRDLSQQVKIICSPKVAIRNPHRSANASAHSPLNKGESVNKYHPIRPDMLSRISAFKFIISASDGNYSKVPDFAKLNSQIPVYVQPMDEYNEAKNQANLQQAAEICQQEGFFLSLQIHKILKIR